MGKIDTATVRALELRAPQASKKDAEVILARVRGGTAFGAFSASERNRILGQLQKVSGLIPSLSTFFKDVRYLELCANSVKRLGASSQSLGVFECMQDKFTGANQLDGHVKIQVGYHAWTYVPGGIAEQKDLGCRQIYAYAMRNYPYMQREASKPNILTRATAKADNAVVTHFADIAYQLGFRSDEIIALRQCTALEPAPEDYSRSTRPAVRTVLDLPIAERCGVPRIPAYEEARDSLFINHLHDERQGEGVTPFFVRQSIYFAFFGRPETYDANKDDDGQHFGLHSHGGSRLAQGPNRRDYSFLSRANASQSDRMQEIMEDISLFVSSSG